MREDGGFIDAGENDNIIVQKLQNNAKALGIFGYSFLEENRSRLQGLVIEGTEPDFDSIAAGDYPISRSLFLYAKMQHLPRVPGLARFLQELTQEYTIGEDGYLAYRGLIPRDPQARQATRVALEKQI
jgi:phosphate transport system substrate-binding protein